MEVQVPRGSLGFRTKVIIKRKLHVTFSSFILFQKLYIIFRSCRYALECETVDQVIANDISISAVQEIHRNAKFNDCSDRIEVANKDAIELMAMRRVPKLNIPVIDLDPYGSATPFLDSAVQGNIHFLLSIF